MAAFELQHLNLLLEGLHFLCLVVHQSRQPLALICVKELASVWSSLGGKGGAYVDLAVNEE